MTGSMSELRKLDLPTLVVTSKSVDAVSASSERKVAYNVQSLDKLIDVFYENEREISNR
jgi:hypothetical protein